VPKKGENIYKRKDGRYEARYVKERDIDNKIIKYGYVYGKTYTEVKLKKNKAIEKIQDMIRIENSVGVKRFYDSIKKWLDTKIEIKDTTYYNYLSIIESKIKPFFKNIRLRDIKDIHIINFVKKLQNDGLSNKRIKDILLVLKQFFKYNRMDIKITYPKVKKKTIQTFQDDEIKIMEKLLLNSTNIKDFGVVFVLFSGLRIGELCALQWKDINLDKQVMKISKTLVRIKNDANGRQKTKVVIDTPKTDTSIRDVPIHSVLVPYLEKFKKNQNEDYFVLTESKNFISTNKYYNYYINLLDRLKIKRYTFHTLRHTFATRALINGIDIKTLSEILGHSSVKITLDRYVHIKADEKLVQINKLPFLTQ